MKVLSTLAIVLCLFLCFSGNHTFPLQRDSKWFLEWYRNHSSQCETYPKYLVERTKKMSSDIENALHKVKSSSQDFSKSLYNRLNRRFGNQLDNKDFRQYEQLVIMKKNPYVDFKELELKYSPSNKNVRQSLNFDPDIGRDVNLCDPIDSPSVQITNRGLSGFAIPNQMKKVDNDIMEHTPNLNFRPDPKMLDFKHSKEYPIEKQYD